MPARVQIVSPDPAFAESIAARVLRWGLSVTIESELARIGPSPGSQAMEVVLLDVRRPEDGTIGWLASLKRAFPGLEVILLNHTGRVAVSIEGMRAGASDELSAPFDLTALRESLFAALRRRKSRLGRARTALALRFERAMSAAAFAEEGEHEAAREMLADPGRPRRRGPRSGGNG